MSVDPSARDNIHGQLIEEYAHNYIETKFVVDATDIDMNFNFHPISGDIIPKTNERAIKQAVMNLVLLNYYEKPFRPDIGGDIYRMLFENYDEVGTMSVVEKTISDLIRDYEPRVKFLRCVAEVFPDENRLKITIYFKIIMTSQEDSVDVMMNIAR